LRIEEEDGWEAFHLILTHKLLVLGAVNARNVDSLSNQLRELAVFWLEASAMATLDSSRCTPGE
jgi:hypothetical protein